MGATRTDGLGTRPVLRLATDADPAWVDLAGCGVDLERGIVRVHEGADRELTSMERKALAYLVRHPRRDIPHEELLQEVWGYAEGVQSRAAYFTMRRIRAKVELDPSAPQHLITVHGVGYRFVPRDPAPAVAARRTNLAGDLGLFFGRTAEIDTLETWAEAGQRLITVVGPAGVGKTRLVRRHGWARSSGSGAPDQLWFCDLTGAGHAGAIVEAVAVAIGVRSVRAGGPGPTGWGAPWRDGAAWCW